MVSHRRMRWIARDPMIKLQNGKVLLKNGKVSCGCCGDCCMYPAKALKDGSYSIADLPDFFYDTSPNASLTFEKLSAPLTENSGTWYYKAVNESGVLERLGLLGNSNDWFFQGGGQTEPCLITNFRESTGRKDEFADTYTVAGPISGAVIRQSLCVWVGAGLRLAISGFQWHINGVPKSESQNSPQGNFGPYTVS